MQPTTKHTNTQQVDIQLVQSNCLFKHTNTQQVDIQLVHSNCLFKILPLFSILVSVINCISHPVLVDKTKETHESPQASETQ